MSPIQAADIVSLLAGEVTVEQVAQRHGATVAEVEGWRAGYLAGLKAAHLQQAHARRLPRGVRNTLLGSLAAVLGLGATTALAQAACSAYPGMPTGLKTFCANAPALASDVNGNFAQLATWLQTKVGPVSSNGVTASSLTVTGNTTATTLSTNNDVTVGGKLTVAGATTLNGQVSVYGTDIRFTSHPVSGNGGRALTHDTGNTLVVGYGGDFTTVRFDKPITFGSGATRTGSLLDVNGGGPWGSWGAVTYCPAGQYVCGLQLRTEGDQSSGDDTALNDVNMACCTLGY